VFVYIDGGYAFSASGGADSEGGYGGGGVSIGVSNPGRGPYAGLGATASSGGIGYYIADNNFGQDGETVASDSEFGGQGGKLPFPAVINPGGFGGNGSNGIFNQTTQQWEGAGSGGGQGVGRSGGGAGWWDANGTTAQPGQGGKGEPANPGNVAQSVFELSAGTVISVLTDNYTGFSGGQYAVITW
jgi:hypothetical protein